MWWQKGLEYLQLPYSGRRSSHFIDRDFQLRYATVVISAALLGLIVAIIPIVYFLDQNYSIFLNLAHLHIPQLINNLERERIWVTTLLVVGFTGLSAFYLVMSFRLTNRIVGPLRVLRNHLRRMSRGQWNMPEVKVRESDEFKDLIEAYNYFYQSFRTNLKRDLDLIKKLKIEKGDAQSLKIWRQLVEEKSLQLNLKSELPYPLLTALPGEADPESRDSRRVS